jgi:hypothetical protein
MFSYRECSPPRSHRSRRFRRPPTPWSSRQSEQENEAFLDPQDTEFHEGDDVAQQHQQHRDGVLWRPLTHDGYSNWYALSSSSFYFRRTDAKISGRTSPSLIVITNRRIYLIGIPKRVPTRPFGPLRVGRRKTAIQVGGRRGLVSRLISRVKEGQSYVVQTRVEQDLRSRAPLSLARPNLWQTRASRSLHRL